MDLPKSVQLISDKKFEKLIYKHVKHVYFLYPVPGLHLQELKLRRVKPL